MNLIVKPISNNLDSYIDCGISYFLLPLKDYSVETVSSFSIDEIEDINKKYPDINLFISINKNIMNEELDSLKDTLLRLDKLDILGAFYYDAAIVSLKKKLGISFDLVWDQSHMVTNYKTCDYYYNQGVKYALLSKEITKEEMIEIIEKSSITSIVEMVSRPSVAFSKRKLVTNYYHDLGKDSQNNISILEKVSGQSYYVNEEKEGTNFIKNSLVHGSSCLDDFINVGLSFILLREDFIDYELFLTIVRRFSDYINNYSNMSDDDRNNWLLEQNKLLGEDFGFFFQKTIYRVKK